MKVDSEHHGAIEIDAEVRDRGNHGRSGADRGHNGRHGSDRTAFAASAVAHFSTGDVTVQLRRDGRSELDGKIRVPRGQGRGESPLTSPSSTTASRKL